MTYYELDSRFIPGHHHPSVIIELGLSRGVDSHVLLKGCGVFYEDILAAKSVLSSAQLQQLLSNAQRLLPDPETAFLIGQQWLPGHYGAASQMLSQAHNLQQALELINNFRALLSPLMSLRWAMDEHRVYLMFQHSFVLKAEQQQFLDQLHATAIVSMCRQLSGQRWTWHMHCNHQRPAYPEQYWLHISEQLHFGYPASVLSLPREHLHQAWPQRNTTACMAAQQQCHEALGRLDGSQSILDALAGYLHHNLRHTLNLERAAHYFGMSPASLKRKLQRHQTGFQQQLDLARTRQALFLYQVQGLSNEEVARWLAFNDTTNFRRSFRRWTGYTPSELRQRLRHF